MNIRDLVTISGKLQYKELCAALVERFGVKQPVKWDSVLPHEQQQSLFGGEILRLISDHPTLANQKEIRPVCLMKGELSQLLFFYIQLKDEKLPKAVIERITRKFVGGAAADRYIIWFFANKAADVLKIVISGKEGKKIRLKTLTLEAGQWFKTYDYILNEVERKFNTGGLFQEFKEPSELWKAIWDAFDISIVNKRFYAEIKGIFDALTKEELPKCKGILTSEQDRTQFAIRLIGRIIFCWFLKRKGIIGDDVLSSKAASSQQNYYRDLLELLFFDVFNTPLNERKKDLPDSIKSYPFLNGGLFEPQHQDHKGNWALNISNDWFINFFNNTLERYNFTVDENSAASSEIAIDPEMLGRIFENLLAEQNPETGESARKATGSYYTPREIVDFMVEESLIAYLKTQRDNKDETMLYPLSKGAQPMPDEAVEEFVHTGTLPDALKSYSEELLDKLNAIKVLDPACGSGAFPISMLQKLAVLKQQLDPNSLPYSLKLKTIENSIYGVDIQPMATELSRLRCWLSLIVDEDPKDIKPLPNLDFKFVTANSLIDLGYDEFIRTMQTKRSGGLLLISNFIKDLEALKSVRQKYFEPSLWQGEKDKLKKEFVTLKNDLFEMSLELITQRHLDAEFSNKITGWEPFDDSAVAPFFDKNWMFGIEDGFDITIGNPPYVRADEQSEWNQRQRKQILATKKYETLWEKWDLFVPFIERSYKLLRPGGVSTLIVSDAFCHAKYAQKPQEWFLKNARIVRLDFCSDLKIFDAAVHNLIYLFQKTDGAHNVPERRAHKKEFGNVVNLPSDEQAKLTYRAFFPEQIEHQVLGERTVRLTDICYVSYGLRPNSDENEAKGEFVTADLVSQTESEIHCKPYVEGKHLSNWLPHEHLWIEWGTERAPARFCRPTFPELYPVSEKLIAQRSPGPDPVVCYDDQGLVFTPASVGFVPWHMLAGVRNNSLKKTARYRSEKPFRHDLPKREELEATSKRFEVKYLLAVMNSTVARNFLRANRRSNIHLYPDDWKKLPIPDVPLEKQKPIVALVEQILMLRRSNAQADIAELEKQIDEMVAILYCLTPE